MLVSILTNSLYPKRYILIVILHLQIHLINYLSLLYTHEHTLQTLQVLPTKFF